MLTTGLVFAGLCCLNIVNRVLGDKSDDNDGALAFVLSGCGVAACIVAMVWIN